MQIGIDVGATKIESVVLDENGNESNRERTDCPKDYTKIIKTIKEISDKLEKELKESFEDGLSRKPNWKTLLKIKNWLDI